jgi:flagella basal body P-ring formation protein FlgA
MRSHLLILLAFLTFAEPSANALDVILRANAQPTSTIVRLGDIADLRADDEKQVQQFAQLPLMPTPAPESRQYLRMQAVRDLLAAQGHDVSQMRFAGADQVLISREQDERPDVAGLGLERPQSGFRQLTPRQTRRTASPASIPLSNTQIDELRSQLANSIIAHVQSASDEARPWRVTFDLERRHAARLQQATTTAAIDGGEAPWIGPQRFLISFATAEGDVRFPVDAIVSEAPTVVIAKRALGRGETLTAADVEVMPLPEHVKIPGQRTAATNVEELLDHEVINPIRAGEVVTTDAFAPPMLVHRGDAVTVAAGGGGIRIRVLAKAQADGRQGEIIEVEAPETKQRFTARVVGPRQLAVLTVDASSAEVSANTSTTRTR